MVKRFSSDDASVDGVAIRNIMCRQVAECNRELTEEEQELIQLVFYKEKTQTELQTHYGISQQAISKRIKKILIKISN